MPNKKIIATHSGKYHTDDLFAVATVQMLLGHENTEMVRTRDQEELKKADYVVDVGGILDPHNNRFDHHQSEDTGTHGNSIPYASFGLVWKKFGQKLTGSAREAKIVEEKLVQPIDADDNGYSLYTLTKEQTYPYTLQVMLSSFRPTSDENKSHDEVFEELLPLARKILEREIFLAKLYAKAEDGVRHVYEKSKDKQMIVFDKHEHYAGRELIGDILCEYTEPVYAIFYKPEDDMWQLLAVKKKAGTFESRKRLPKSWGGNKTEEELERLTRFPDVMFVHNNGFMAVTKSKETAVALAKKSLEMESAS